MQRTNRNSHRRAGSATVELAICLPLLVTIVFGAIEACHMIHIRESLHVAAYEAGRAVIRKDSQAGDGEKRAGDVLAARGIHAAAVEVVPANVHEISSGREIWITVSSPGVRNAYRVLKRQRVSVTATFVKE